MLSMNLWKIKLMSMFGIKASLEEMKDFDLDYNEWRKAKNDNPDHEINLGKTYFL